MGDTATAAEQVVDACSLIAGEFVKRERGV
jgi:hypothetical protein